jgi:Universal stress protein family
VLAALDGTPADRSVVAWAAGEAAHLGAQLRLAHVLTGAADATPPAADPWDLIEAARAVAVASRPDLQVDGVVRAGGVAPALLTEAAARARDTSNSSLRRVATPAGRPASGSACRVLRPLPMSTFVGNWDDLSSRLRQLHAR